MNHNKRGRKLNRTSEHRNAMLRNMATSLFLHGRIETTTEKAKELRRFAEPIITRAKRGDLHARRLVAAAIYDENAVTKLFADIAPRYAARPGGYTRVLHLGHRPGDAADMSIIELVD